MSNDKVKDVMFGEDARTKMLRGANILADAVKVTLGAGGKNVIINDRYNGAHITKDGVTIAKSITLKCPFEDIGAQIVKKVSAQSNIDVGDGTTTATVIAQAILNSGIRLVVSGANPMDLKRGIDLGVAKVIELIGGHRATVINEPEIYNIANISANGDAEIAKIVTEAILSVGSQGVIQVKGSTAPESTLEIIKGMRFKRPMISTYLATNSKTGSSELDAPRVLLIDGKLIDVDALAHILTEVNGPLFIMADDYSGRVIEVLSKLANTGAVKVVAVKSPAFGDRRKGIVNDIAVSTGATVVGDAFGLALNDVTLGMLGRCVRTVVSKVNTTIYMDDTIDVTDHIADLEYQLSEAVDVYETSTLEDRIANLGSGIAEITVGGTTEFAINELIDRYDDAVGAVKSAVDGGILPGGGVALARLSEILDVTCENDDQRAGVNILRTALQAPLKQIADNCGVSPDVILAGVLSNTEMFSWGWNAKTKAYGDMYQLGIIDPAAVTISAVSNAASISGLMLTTECIITDALL